MKGRREEGKKGRREEGKKGRREEGKKGRREEEKKRRREEEKKRRREEKKKRRKKKIREEEKKNWRADLGLWGEDPVPAKEQEQRTGTFWVGVAQGGVGLESVQNGGSDPLSPETCKATIHTTPVRLDVPHPPFLAEDL